MIKPNQTDPNVPPEERGQVTLQDGVRVDKQGRLLCTAKNRAGQPCSAPSVSGTRVCRNHGGASPQARRKAKLRLAELVDPAIATIARVMTDPNTKPSEKLRAADSLLDRAGHGRAQKIETEDAKALLMNRLIALKHQEDNTEEEVDD